MEVKCQERYYRYESLNQIRMDLEIYESAVRLLNISPKIRLRWLECFNH